jgi:hypothetical protein
MAGSFAPWRPRRSGWRALLLLALLAALGACRGGDEFTSEGTAAGPVALNLPVNARESQVGPNSSSYFSVTPVTDGSFHTASITQLVSDADLFVYADSGFTSVLCVSSQDGTADEACTATVPTGAGVTILYIKIKSNSEKGTNFLFTVN